MTFDSEGRILAALDSYQANQTLKTWDSATGQLLASRALPALVHNPERAGLPRQQPANPLAVFSPDRHLVAVANALSPSARILDTNSGKEIEFTGHEKGIGSLVFSPDGKHLATADGERTLRIWDVASRMEIHVLRGHSAPVRALAFSPDGAQLASAGADKLIRVWDARTGQEVTLLRGHAHPIVHLAFSPDGRLLASVGLVRGSLQSELKVWDAVAWQESWALPRDESRVQSVAFSPDSRRLATSAWRGGIRLYVATTGEEILSLPGRYKAVTFSADGRRLAAATEARCIRVWDATRGYEEEPQRKEKGR